MDDDGPSMVSCHFDLHLTDFLTRVEWGIRFRRNSVVQIKITAQLLHDSMGWID